MGKLFAIKVHGSKGSWRKNFLGAFERFVAFWGFTEVKGCFPTSGDISFVQIDGLGDSVRGFSSPLKRSEKHNQILLAALRAWRGVVPTTEFHHRGHRRDDPIRPEGSLQERGNFLQGHVVTR